VSWSCRFSSSVISAMSSTIRGLSILTLAKSELGIPPGCTPIVGIPQGDDWLIAGSRRGAEGNPAWFYNVLANPDVEIETPNRGTLALHATQLFGADRDEAWTHFTTLSPVFEQYQAGISRVIPVLRLSSR
jgi:deazaflavin-dependent oxidoreductase (nitroreductase family)